MLPIQIFIVEDNNTMRLGISESLRREGYSVSDFESGPDALAQFKKNPAHIVITDLKMEPINGIELLKSIKSLSPETEVLLISAFGTVDTAVEAMQEGAVDFLTKPFSPDELRIRIKKIVEKINQKETIELLTAEKQILQDQYDYQYEEIIGNSQVMKKLFSLINRIANQESTILIEGESGTGKELVARAIHKKSNRANKPFIKINCGALNENLLESELFGHEKGSFTGAIRQKRGRFELANNGTLFLDEIGDISQNMQVKLLRAIQEKEFERVGGENTIKVDVRIISATNRNLTQLVSEGQFREDLFYRLSVIPIKLPALRERKEDIPLLVSYFMNKLLQSKPSLKRYISDEGLNLFKEYCWPGNIRELENVIERLIVISPDQEIKLQLIAQQLGKDSNYPQHRAHTNLDEALFKFEKNLIVHALEEAGGVKNQAAKILGIRTSTLYYKMEKYGLSK